MTSTSVTNAAASLLEAGPAVLPAHPVAGIHTKLSPLIQRLIDTNDPAVGDVVAAERLSRALVQAQYENFSVVSTLLPRALRQDFCNVYAFCRTADDLGDELGSPEASIAALGQLRQQLHEAFAGRAATPLMTVIRRTSKKHDLPIDPFVDLISAFEQDQTVTRYPDHAQLMDYCRRSADPVGRLVLLMCGYRDERRARLSDRICSALQLINFWQDVRRDLVDRDRVYLPADAMASVGLTEDDLRRQLEQGSGDSRFKLLIEQQVRIADAMFDEGRALLPLLRRSVRGQISLFAAGGEAISRAIKQQGYDTLRRRPSLSASRKLVLVAKAVLTAGGVAIGDAMSSMMRRNRSRDRSCSGESE